jgi:hypothetical protein
MTRAVLFSHPCARLDPAPIDVYPLSPPMPFVFTNPGRAAVVSSSQAIPGLIGLEGWDGYLTFKSILTGIGVSGQTAAQFSHSLRDHIYVYSFGERVGDLSVQGLAFAGTCEAASMRSTGLDWLIYYYNNFRLSTIGRPVTVVVGALTALGGFLTGFSAQAQDPETGLTQFTLQFKYPPPLPLTRKNSSTGKTMYYFPPPPDADPSQP